MFNKKARLSLLCILFVYFILFLLAIMTGVLLILFSTGGFPLVLGSVIFSKNELEHITGDVTREFDTLSVEGVALAELLTGRIESRLEAEGVKPSELKDHPIF